MINDLKLGFKALKFAHALKSTLVFSILFVIVGVAMCFLGLLGSENMMSGYFIMMFSVFSVQLLWSVNISNLVQTSPAKKRLQTSVPTVMHVFCMTAGYLLMVLIEVIIACVKPDRINNICVLILFTAGIMGIIMIYTAACYKYFVISMLLFLTCFLISYSFLVRGTDRLAVFLKSDWNSFLLTSVLGLVFIWVCGALQYVISLALYRAPLSKRAQSATLRRQL